MTRDEILCVKQAAVEAEKRFKKRVDAATFIQRLWKKVRHDIANRKLSRSQEFQSNLYYATQKLKADTMRETYNYDQHRHSIDCKVENPIKVVPKNKYQNSNHKQIY